MRNYRVEVSRDGRWWMIHVPEIGQLTQARRISEIEDMARSLIAISTETARRAALQANQAAQRAAADEGRRPCP